MSFADLFGIAAVALGIAAIVDLRRRNKRVRRDTFGGRKGLSWHQMDELVGQEIKEDKARRTRLWQEAASNPRAARQLQREIRDELAAIDDIRREAAQRNPKDKDSLQYCDLRGKELEQELERVADLVRRLPA